MALNNQVAIRVDRDFFDKIFEPTRKQMEKKLGVRVSQTKLTRMMFVNKMDITPKLNLNFKSDLKLRSMKIKNLPNINGIKKNTKRKK